MKSFRLVVMVLVIYALRQPIARSIAVSASSTTSSTVVPENSSTTSTILPIVDAEVVDDNTNSIVNDPQPLQMHQNPNDADDAFQLLKSFVYPVKFSDTAQHQSMHVHPHARNITLDVLHMLWPSLAMRQDNFAADDDQQVWRRSDMQPQQSQRRHYYAYGNEYPQQSTSDGHHQQYPLQNSHALQQPHTFQGGSQSFGGGGMTHLIDPLFVMATLAFVAFLINSILGLVDRLNLLPAVIRGRQRHGKYSGAYGGADDYVMWPQRRQQAADGADGGEAMLGELEQRIRTAFDEYERCYVRADCQ